MTELLQYWTIVTHFTILQSEAQLTILQINAHLIILRIRTHLRIIFLLQSSHVDRKLPDTYLYENKYKSLTPIPHMEALHNCTHILGKYRFSNSTCVLATSHQLRSFLHIGNLSPSLSLYIYIYTQKSKNNIKISP